MLRDVDVQEVARLARAMTCKFAACRVPYAGAKAGIRFAGGDRGAVIAAYKRALEPYADVFLTGLDMGTFPGDFLEPGENPVPLCARSHEGLGMDDLATGHGVKAAAEAALSHLGRDLEGAALAIEGFGRVGAGTARACTRAGARVVGISTVYGLLTDPDGLDVGELLESARAPWRRARPARAAADAPAPGALRARLRRSRAGCPTRLDLTRHRRTPPLRSRRAGGQHPVRRRSGRRPPPARGRGGPGLRRKRGGVYLYELVAQDEPREDRSRRRRGGDKSARDGGRARRDSHGRGAARGLPVPISQKPQVRPPRSSTDSSSSRLSSRAATRCRTDRRTS
jgi:Glutamate/Leucine/Phenylalanine/Valine dehydrogenase